MGERHQIGRYRHAVTDSVAISPVIVNDAWDIRSMGNNLLLVGSVPFDSVEEVMRTFGGALAKHLPAIPDGEVGERRSWVNRLSYQIFNGHMDLETIRRPKSVDGVEQLLPRSRDDAWNFRVRP